MRSCGGAEHGRLIALGTPGELIRQLEQGLQLMVVALGGFVIYSIVTNLVAWPVMGRVFFPNAT